MSFARLIFLCFSVHAVRIWAGEQNIETAVHVCYTWARKYLGLPLRKQSRFPPSIGVCLHWLGNRSERYALHVIQASGLQRIYSGRQRGTGKKLDPVTYVRDSLRGGGDGQILPPLIRLNSDFHFFLSPSVPSLRTLDCSLFTVVRYNNRYLFPPGPSFHCV